MRLPIFALVLVAVLICPAGLVSAQTLPPPRVVPSETPPVQPLAPGVHLMPAMPPGGYPMPLMPYGLPPGYRPSAYQHWQYYGLTYSGFLRPRVLQATYGGYYLNGYPFPQVNVYPGHHFMPIAKD